MASAEMRAGLDPLLTWVPQQKAAANRRVIAVMRRRRMAAGRAGGPHVAGAGLAWVGTTASRCIVELVAVGNGSVVVSLAAGPASPVRQPTVPGWQENKWTTWLGL
jgi:hypothetical protein